MAIESITRKVLCFLQIRDNTIKRKKVAATYAFGTCLDVGSAWNFNEFLLEGTLGLDISQPPNKLPKNYSRFVQGDAQRLSEYFSDQYFDTIVATEPIEHLENPCSFLDECAKLLRWRGRLVISTPNPYLWYRVIANVFFRKGTTNTLSHLNF